MNILCEYIFCFIYTLSLFICCYPYLKMKKSYIRIFIFLLVYAFVDLLITGNYIIDLQKYFVSNLLVIISDYFFIGFYERKLSIHILFYTLLYFCIYTLFVNSFLLVYTHYGVTLIDIYENFILRTLLVFIYAVATISIYKILEKIKIIPKSEIVIGNPWLFNFINIVVILAYLIFFGLRLIDMNSFLIEVIFALFICLWLVLLYLSNRSISLLFEKSRLEVIEVYQENTDRYIENYKKEVEETRKIKHDIKNHLIVIQSMDQLNEIKEYIHSIIVDIEDVSGNKFQTGYNALDIIFEVKERQYPHIHYTYDIDLKNLRIDIKDVVSVLFNLIDNASQNISIHKPIVHISAVQSVEDILIRVINVIDGHFNFNSKKGKGHGYGLSIIESIAEKYKGEFSIDCYDNKVIAQVALKNIGKE